MHHKHRNPTQSNPPDPNDAHAIENLLSEPEAAHCLGVCPRTLWGLRKAGAITAIRIKSRVLYSRDDINRFIAANRTATADQQEVGIKEVARG